MRQTTPSAPRVPSFTTREEDLPVRAPGKRCGATAVDA